MIIRRIVNCFLLAFFVLNVLVGDIPSARAQAVSFPQPIGITYHSPLLKGIKVYAREPFRFDFVLDEGNFGQSSSGTLIRRQDAERLVKYFLASLTIPDKDMWVNLSPYEKDRIVPESFGRTEMGRDLLEQDFQLKQMTARLLHPDSEEGRRFWGKVYGQLSTKFGLSDIPVDTFNKVWIVPGKAVVYEREGAAWVVESKLKVMLDKDFSKAAKGESVTPVQELTRDMMREVVIPILEKEVNEGRDFAVLRQVYQSFILACWYRSRLMSSVLREGYVGKNKLGGIDANDKDAPQRIWEMYVKAFKEASRGLIKDDIDVLTGEVVPRKYASGGAVLDYSQMVSLIETVTVLPASVSRGNYYRIPVVLRTSDQAQAENRGDDQSGSSRLGQMLYRVWKKPLGGIGRLRVQQVNDLVLTETEQESLLEKMNTRPDLKCVFLRRDLIAKTLNTRHRVVLEKGMGVIPKAFIGKEVQISRTASAVLEDMVSDEMSEFAASRSIDVKVGGYYRIKLFDPDMGELYLLTFNPEAYDEGELLLSPLGGGMQYEEDVAGRLEGDLDIKLNVAYSEIGSLMAWLGRGVHREKDPLRELLEEAVGEKSQLGLFDTVPVSARRRNLEQFIGIIGEEHFKQSGVSADHEAFVKAVMRIDGDDVLAEQAEKLEYDDRQSIGQVFAVEPLKVIEELQQQVSGAQMSALPAKEGEVAARDLSREQRGKVERMLRVFGREREGLDELAGRLSYWQYGNGILEVVDSSTGVVFGAVIPMKSKTGVLGELIIVPKWIGSQRGYRLYWGMERIDDDVSWFVDNDEKVIQIYRIYFRNKRNGFGNALLGWLKLHAKRQGISVIKNQNTRNPQMLYSYWRILEKSDIELRVGGFRGKRVDPQGLMAGVGRLIVEENKDYKGLIKIHKDSVTGGLKFVWGAWGKDSAVEDFPLTEKEPGVYEAVTDQSTGARVRLVIEQNIFPRIYMLDGHSGQEREWDIFYGDTIHITGRFLEDKAQALSNGGIQFDPSRLVLEKQGLESYSRESLDRSELVRLQSSAGLVPDVLRVESLSSLSGFIE